MKKNVVLINRWTSAVGFTSFETYIDQEAFCAHYLVTAGSRSAIQAPAERVCMLQDLEFDTIAAELERLIAAHGAIDCLIAMAEKDLLVAGQLRECFGIPGQTFAEARKFIDKGIMKQVIAAAGIETPRFRELADGPEGLQFPLILKPKCEASSRGVEKVTSPAELAAKSAGLRARDYLLEEFCPDGIYHLDGFVDRGEIVFLMSNQYVGTCLAHAHGQPLGSVQATDPARTASFRGFAGRVIKALKLESGSFHLECFLRGETPVFLEIGARAGGGDIREVIALAHGFDIVKAWIDVQLGRRPQLPRNPDPARAGGWLIFPASASAAILESASSFRGRFTCLQREYIFSRGHRFSGAGDVHTHSAARFLFAGPESDIREAMRTILASFRASYREESAAVVEI
ncbi:MAG TPA: hypothetical protein VN915_02545 [Elusimicrobiota bacterium]|nr:hypothetical protein [Elusimicrobiota bacterium]